MRVKSLGPIALLFYHVNSLCNWRNWPWCLWFVTAGSLVGRREGSGSQLTVSVTSTWCWSLMSLVLVIFKRRGSKAQRPTGWVWVVIGVRTGSLMLFLLVNRFLLESLVVIDEPPLLGTLYPPIGNLVKPSPEKTFGFEKWMQFPPNWYIRICLHEWQDF